MYFWKIENLKKDIRAGEFTEQDRFIYAFIYIVLSIIGMEAMSFLSVENPNMWDTIGTVGNIVIPIVGTFFAYRANGAGDGSDFLGRFFSINFVVGIRFCVLLIPMIVGLFFYYTYAFSVDEEISSTPIDIIPFQIWLSLLYVRICKHIRDTDNPNS
ncbi:hypothetical protein L4D76_27100 [Photobacterium sagamiensis]|uniref:hypothetical protein n=1 Tax=Photobacterium sagamiensis TaxID=2910241 RepID=UPI003D11D16F